VWNVIQYVGTGLSLAAFVVAAILLAYRSRLKQRAEIIKSAPENERLEAIAATAEFFRVDVSGLTRAQQREIVLAQIHARAQRDLLLAGGSLIVAVLLAAVAIVGIVMPRAFPEKTESNRISLRQRIRFKNPTGTEASMGWESHIRRICVIA
jgi:hypothetical protein